MRGKCSTGAGRQSGAMAAGSIEVRASRGSATRRPGMVSRSRRILASRAPLHFREAGAGLGYGQSAMACKAHDKGAAVMSHARVRWVATGGGIAAGGRVGGCRVRPPARGWGGTPCQPTALAPPGAIGPGGGGRREPRDGRGGLGVPCRFCTSRRAPSGTGGTCLPLEPRRPFATPLARRRALRVGCGTGGGAAP